MSPLTFDEKRRMEAMEATIELLDTRLNQIEGKINTLLAWAKGLLIGIAIAGVIFGWLSLEQFAKLLK